MNLFYCLGVPRSGTTYFSHLVNSHPRALCGVENFAPGRLQAQWFEIENFLEPILHDSTRSFCAQQLRRKPDLLALGDKFPRAYLHYEHLMEELKAAVFFVIFRDPVEVFCSWDARAADSEDHWDSGRNWVIAYLEMTLLLKQLKRRVADQMFLVSYAHLVGAESRKEAANQILTLLNLAFHPSIDGFLNDSLPRTQRSMEKPRASNGAQDLLLSMPHMRFYASELVGPLGVAPVRECGALIDEFCNLLGLDVDRNAETFSASIARSLDSGHSTDYLKNYLQENREVYQKAGLGELIELVNQSSRQARKP